MKIPSFSTPVLILAVLAFISGCKDLGEDLPVTGPPGTPGSSGAQISFRNEVLPIFQKYGCFQCHGGQNNLITSTPADLLRGGLHGPAIVPGNADASLIIQKTLTPPPFGDRMPQGVPALPDSIRNVIRAWINQGAKDN